MISLEWKEEDKISCNIVYMSSNNSSINVSKKTNTKKVGLTIVIVLVVIIVIFLIYSAYSSYSNYNNNNPYLFLHH
jgi:uncharacterized protein with PQ loop repeat